MLAKPVGDLLRKKQLKLFGEENLWEIGSQILILFPSQRQDQSFLGIKLS